MNTYRTRCTTTSSYSLSVLRPSIARLRAEVTSANVDLPAPGLKLLDVLNTLRKEARPGSQLQQELEAFDDQREQDGAELAPGCRVDLNSPLDVFYSVYDMVRKR